MTSTVTEGDQVLLTRIGANDPNFNLRRDPGLIHRRTGGNTVFASLYEMHGRYSYADEIPINSFTSVANLEVLFDSENYTEIQFELRSGAKYVFAFSQNDKEDASEHKTQLESGVIEWIGSYQFKKITAK